MTQLLDPILTVNMVDVTPIEDTLSSTVVITPDSSKAIPALGGRWGNLQLSDEEDSIPSSPTFSDRLKIIMDPSPECPQAPKRSASERHIIFHVSDDEQPLPNEIDTQKQLRKARNADRE
jgi:hypothetical protein